jgi:hypothetical protein
MVTQIRRWFSFLALVLPTLSMLVLGACGQRSTDDEQGSRLVPGPPDLAAPVQRLNLSAYGVTEVVRDQNMDAVTIAFADGTRVVVRSNTHPVEGAWELRAVSSDGSTAERTSRRGWPVIHYVDQSSGALKRGALYLARTAKDELDQWRGFGNSAAFSLIALDVYTYAEFVGEYDLNHMVRVFSEADDEAPAGGGGRGLASPKQTAPAADGGAPAPAVDHTCTVHDFGDEECEITPAQQCLVDVVETGWYPCVKFVVLSLISGLGTYWTCGPCITFLWTLIPALLGYISNPFGWLGLLGGAAVCAGCLFSAWALFESAKAAFNNCFFQFPPPKGCAGPTPTATEVN